MSLGPDQYKVQYEPVIETAAFTYPYKFWDEGELVVTIFGADLVEVVLVIGDDYTVVYANGDPENGATVNLVTPLPVGSTITIERIIPISSEADYTTGDGIPPATLNESFDKAAAQVQQLEAQIGQSIVFPTTDPAGITYTLASVDQRAGKALLFDANGGVIVGTLVSGEFFIDSTKGLLDTSGLISVAIDPVIFEFNGSGQLSIPQSAIDWTKLVPMVSGTVLGNADPSGTDNPKAVEIVGDLLLDQDDLIDDDATKGVTQQSVKAYIDAQIAAYSLQNVYPITVFGSAAYETDWTELDLSAWTGAQRTLCFLIIRPVNAAVVGFRTWGLSNQVGTAAASRFGGGITAASMDMGTECTVAVISNGGGSVGWKSDNATFGTIILQAFQVLV